MSADAVKAFRSIRPHLPGLLDAAKLGKYSRPSVGALVAVGEELAWRYNPVRRGYVDETVEQLCETLPLGFDTVKRALQALHALEIWSVDRRGGSRDRYGSRRIPGPALCAAAHAAGLDLSTPQTRLDLGPELGATLRPDTTELGATLRPDTTELGATLRPDTTELGATLRGTRRNLARNSAQPCATPKEPKNQKNPPTPLAAPIDLLGTQQMRREEVLTEYGRQAVERRYAPPNNPAKYAASAIATAREDLADLNRWLKTYPEAPANQIASWMHGEKQSMRYANEARG